MHSDGIGGFEWIRAEVLVQGGKQRRITLPPGILCLVPAECLANVVTG
jgi:hypothetical protein